MKGRVSQGNFDGSLRQILKQDNKIHVLLRIHQSIKYVRNDLIQQIGTFCHSSGETTSKENPVIKHCFILFLSLHLC